MSSFVFPCSAWKVELEEKFDERRKEIEREALAMLTMYLGKGTKYPNTSVRAYCSGHVN